MISVMKSIAHPWQCDVLNHLTTRFYVAMFDDASYHLLNTAFGWKGNQDNEGKIAAVDVRHVINYQAEVAAGDLLEIHAGLTKVGGKSFTVLYEMKNLRNGEIAATLESTCVVFDLQQRKAVVIPDEMRARANALLIPVQEEK